MHPVSLDGNGAIADVFRPGVYRDSNFLRHYIIYEGAENWFDENGNEIELMRKNEKDVSTSRTQEEEYASAIRSLVNPKGYLKEFGQIRYISTRNLSSVSLIFTPINLLELYKIHAEISFKNLCADSIGVKQIQRKGDKEIGKLLSKMYKSASDSDGEDVFRDLVKECYFDTFSISGPEFDGTFYVDNINLQISIHDIGDFLWLLSFLQLEAADILQIHTAKMLRCDYFATLDKGISSNKKIIQKSTGVEILASPIELVQKQLEFKKEHIT